MCHFSSQPRCSCPVEIAPVARARISAALLIFRMRLDGQHCEVSFVRPVSPEQATGGG